jgi:hypothetical protein
MNQGDSVALQVVRAIYLRERPAIEDREVEFSDGMWTMRETIAESIFPSSDLKWRPNHYNTIKYASSNMVDHSVQLPLP